MRWLYVPASGGFTDTKSVSFNGSSSKLTSGAASSIDFDGFSQAYSIGFWIKTNSASSKTIISRLEPTNFKGPYYITMGGGNVGIQIAANENTSHYIQKSTNTAAVTTSAWHFVVMSYTGNANASGVTFYVDGSSQTANTAVNSLNASTVSGVAMVMGTDNFAAGPFFDGLLDEVSFWNIALSSGNVTTLYNSGAPTNLSAASFAANLVSWYRMGDSPDTTSTINDVVGSNNLTGTNITISSDVP